MSPEEATKLIRGMEHLCYEAERAEVVQPVEEKSLGNPYSTSQYLKRPTRELGGDFLQEMS